MSRQGWRHLSASLRVSSVDDAVRRGALILASPHVTRLPTSPHVGMATTFSPSCARFGGSGSSPRQGLRGVNHVSRPFQVR